MRNSIVDIFLGVLNWLYVKPKAAAPEPPAIIPKSPEEVDWASILYHGDRRLNRDLRGKKDRRKRAGVR